MRGSSFLSDPRRDAEDRDVLDLSLWGQWGDARRLGVGADGVVSAAEAGVRLLGRRLGVRRDGLALALEELSFGGMPLCAPGVWNLTRPVLPETTRWSTPWPPSGQ